MMDWDEAIEEAKDELGISGYTSNWDEVVETAQDILDEWWCNEREILSDISKEEHQKYLKSEEWKALREAALIRDKFKCRDCEKPAMDVHHNTYKHIKNPDEEIYTLFSLCRICHKKRHNIR